jgi:hypothetical protein
MTVINFVTLKAAAKRELLFNKPDSEAGLLNKGTCLAAALGMAEFITEIEVILVTLCCAT